ncbi:MAG TPA: GH92 family glycosyl hydrolase [Bacteroidales bacterium]|nr:GH92 family glycosyl hydrolase [Bacteroidales bacterium]
MITHHRCRTSISFCLVAWTLLLTGCQPKPQTTLNAHEINSPDESGREPYDYVDPFIGTGGEGHTYPGATVPFGSVQVSPDTEIKYFRQSFPWCAGYQYGDSTIVGFSHTHFSGTGHSDLGDVLLMPVTGELQLIPGSSAYPDSGYRSRFSHEQEKAEPGYYAVRLTDDDISVELTATEHVGFHQYTFPHSDTGRIILDLTQSIYNYDDKVRWSYIRIENDTLVTGYRHTSGWAPDRYLYFAISFSKPFQSYGVVREDKMEYFGFGPRQSQMTGYPERGGRKIKAYFNFPDLQAETIGVKVGISAVDISGALNNMKTECPGWNFDEIRTLARQKWEKELRKIIIEGSQEQKTIFYTSMYHSLLAPVIYTDTDGRYRGLDQQIHHADGFTNYTIYSLWDTYRATHPLFTILQPDRVPDMIRSMLAHYDQSVHHVLPVWSFHGNETWCMIGYHAVSVIADAFQKGIRGFEPEHAFQAMKASATYGPYDGLNSYMHYGFVPIDKEPEGASKTLEYAYDDWAIAQMARELGKEEDYRYFLARSASYRNIWDAETGFMRARRSDSSFREPFDPFYAQYGGDYTEGNAWQYSWYVPHDPEGLIRLMGGAEVFAGRIDSLFILEAGKEKYSHVEDIAGLIGQYAHGNEPSQHIAYLYVYAGMPWKTQERIHQIMQNLFDDTPYGICGNEDCGQMSAWYIFSSLGFYPVCPGSNQYVIGTPAVRQASLFLENGKVFTITAQNQSSQNIYIQSMILNGQPYERYFLDHAMLMKGGHLQFIMGPEPVKRSLNSDGIPYSMSKQK